MTIDDVRSENENFEGDGKENDKNRSGIEMRAFKTKMRTMVPMGGSTPKSTTLK